MEIQHIKHLVFWHKLGIFSIQTVLICADYRSFFSAESGDLCPGCAAFPSVPAWYQPGGSTHQDPRPAQLTAGLWPGWERKCRPVNEETERMWFYPLCPSREPWLLLNCLPFAMWLGVIYLRAWLDWCGLSVQLRLAGRKAELTDAHRAVQ